MRLHHFIAFFVLGCVFYSSEASAVGVEFDGYYRLRYNSFYNLDLDQGQKPNLRSYTDMRFRLDPLFMITDEVRIYSSWNLLDGALGSDPLRARTSANPAKSKDILALSSDASQVGRQIQATDRSSLLYGGAYAADAAVESTELTPIQLRRAWAEVETGFGIAKFGRMPFHLGLGIYANAGDDFDQDVGTTRDRVAFESAYGPYYFMPGIGWSYEGLLDHSQDDSYEYFFLIGRRVEGNQVSLYLSYLAQDSALVAEQNGDLSTKSTSYWIIDLYTEQMFRQIKFELEVALFVGRFLGYDLFAVNSASRVSWQREKFNWLGEIGFSSGTTEKDFDSNKLKTFMFNRDYNVSQILFEEILPGGASLADDAEGDERPTNPRAGAISNAVYLRSKFDYKLTDWFTPSLNVIVPMAVQRSPQSGGHFYGVEYNLSSLWQFNRYFTGDFTFAHFIPGSFFKTSSSKDQSFLIRVGLGVEF